MCTRPHPVRDILCCPPQVPIRDFHRRHLPEDQADGKLFNFARLKAITKTQLKLLLDFLFADDAAVVAHSGEELQQLMRRFSTACKHFGLTISLKKTQVMGEGVPYPPGITISNHQLEVVHDLDWQGINHHVQPDKESLEEWKTHGRKHQDSSIQGVRAEHVSVWKRVLSATCIA